MVFGTAQIWMADPRDNADKAFDHFLACHEVKYEKATRKLIKDREELMNFFDFPVEQGLPEPQYHAFHDVQAKDGIEVQSDSITVAA